MYNFPWQQDAEGYYLVFNTDQGAFEARDTNTMMYLYPDMPEADHVWIQVDESYGFRLFREHIDRVGEGAFGSLCDQLFEHGFEMSDEEDPQECDIEAFYEHFNRRPESINTIDKIVKLALDNLDAKAEYYIGHEWS